VTPYYSDSYVTLYHARWEDVPAELLRADVLVTDPPYGVAWDVGDAGFRAKNRVRLGTQYDPIVGDDRPFDPAPLLALGLPSVLFGGNHYASRLPDSPAWLCWDKRVTMNSNDQSDCELAWSNIGGRARMFRMVWNGGGVLMRENQRRGGAGASVTVHPTQKPLALMKWVLELCPEGVVLDPYAGSGTTLVAAKALGRQAIGVECVERYAEVAASRLSQEVLGL
jgi:site-specific DNA-methyltransferase (adenine-specific)